MIGNPRVSDRTVHSFLVPPIIGGTDGKSRLYWEIGSQSRLSQSRLSSHAYWLTRSYVYGSVPPILGSWVPVPPIPVPLISGGSRKLWFLPTVTSWQTSRKIKIGIRVAFQSILIHFWLLQNLPSAFVNSLCSIFNYSPQTNIANFIHSESVVPHLSPRWSTPEFFCLWRP